MTEHLNGKQCAADRTNDRVHCVPNGVDPRDFISEKFQEIQNAGNCDDPWVTEDLERLVLRRKRDPMKVNCEAGDENSQVKINPGERGKTESDRKKIEFLHGENILADDRLSRASPTWIK